MSSLLDTLGGLVKSTYCQILNNDLAVANAAAYALGPVIGSYYRGPQLVRTVRSLFCDDAPSPRPGQQIPGPPGIGQCSKRYNITVTYQYGDGTTNTTSHYGYWGPLGSIVPVDYNGNPGSFGPNCNGAQIYAHGDDATVPTAAPVLMPLTGGGGPTGVASIVSVNVQTSDGSDDNCTPQIYPPPAKLPDTGYTVPNVPFSFGGQNYNADITLFQPTLSPAFVLVGPFFINTNIAFDVGTLQIGGNITLPGSNIEFNFAPQGLPPSPSGSGGGGGGTLPPVTPVGEPPSPPSDTKPDPGNPGVTKKTVVIGVQVNVSSVSNNNKATRIPQVGNPTIYAPSLGFVSFYIKDAKGNPLGWTTDIPVKNTYQYIPCPVQTGAAGVSGTPNPGVTWTLTPVTATIEVNR